MGFGLGQKISKGINNLGNKAHNIANTLGQKTNGLLKYAQKTANTVGNEALDTAKQINRGVNQIDNQAQLALRKSGDITNGIRQGANYLDKGIKGITNVANAVGIGNVPIVGQALNTASSLTGQLNKGANKLDEYRDKADIERQNLRKKYDEIKNSVTNEYNNFAH